MARWTLFGLSYSEIGWILGIVAAIVTFLGAYIYCIITYGFLLGLGLGWLPSGILAALIGLLAANFWRPLLMVILFGLICAIIVVAKFA
jgi:hypothetical protein